MSGACSCVMVGTASAAEKVYERRRTMERFSFGEKPRREHIAARVVNTGLGANIILAVLKVTVGIVGHSRALLADGINSTSDVAYYIAVKIFTHFAGEPADREHPYGHQQMESIAAVVIGAFVITTAIAIFWNSINTAYDIWSTGGNGSGTFRLFALSTSLGTIAAKVVLFFATRSAAQSTSNPALLALAFDHRNDIFSSAGAAVGIALAWVGISWCDPLAGACVALIVLRTGIHILRESSAELMDRVPGEELDRKIREILVTVEGVRTIDNLWTHRFGPYLVVNITIGVDGAISVAQGDLIATRVEERLYDGIDLLKDVHVHFHPAP